MGESATRDFRALALPTVAGLIVARWLGAQTLAVYDDAFITFRYARNLASGQGFVYHADEWVLGTTAPAFGLLQAGLYALGLPLQQAAVALNVVCDAAILLLVLRMLLPNCGVAAALGFAGLYAASPLLTRVCVGGLESELFLLGALAATALYTSGRAALAIALATLLYFLRPEAVLLVLVLGVHELGKAGFRPTLRLAGISVAVVAPFLALVYALYGDVIPASVYAKADTPGDSTAQVLRALFATDPVALVCLPFALLGARRVSRAPALALFAAFALVYALAYLLARPHVWSWYAAPVQLAVVAVAPLGALALLERLPEGWLRIVPSARVAALAVGAAVVALWAGVRLATGPSAVTANVTEPIAAYAAANMDENTTVLATDIGMIGYFSNGRIYDAAGLVWPEALAYGSWTEIALERRPDYILLTAHRKRIAQLQGAGLADLYTAVTRFSRYGKTSLSLDPDAFVPRWSQDYVLLHRND